jgi:hypothetical protein
MSCAGDGPVRPQPGILEHQAASSTVTRSVLARACRQPGPTGLSACRRAGSPAPRASRPPRHQVVPHDHRPRRPPAAAPGPAPAANRRHAPATRHGGPSPSRRSTAAAATTPGKHPPTGPRPPCATWSTSGTPPASSPAAAGPPPNATPTTSSPTTTARPAYATSHPSAATTTRSDTPSGRRYTMTRTSYPSDTRLAPCSGGADRSVQPSVSGPPGPDRRLPPVPPVRGLWFVRLAAGVVSRCSRTCDSPGAPHGASRCRHLGPATTLPPTPADRGRWR